MLRRSWQRVSGTLSALSVCALLVFSPLPALAFDNEAQRLVADLKSPDFARRQEAMLALERLGVAAIDELARAATADDAEVRGRATSVIMSKGLSAQNESRQAVRRALNDLSQSSDHDVRSRAKATLALVQETAATAAAGELTRFSAVLMPAPGAVTGAYNVQIGANWSGRSEHLSLLAELVDVPWLSLESAPVGDDALPHIARLGERGGGPTKLFLGNSRLSGTRLATLAPLGRMQYLSLRQLPVTDAQLASLPEFPDLQYLGLDGTRITAAGLAALGTYRQLQVLWLDNTQVSDAGLVHLQPLSNLRTLYLPGTQCSGPGLAALAKLPGLTSLSLKGVKLAADSLKYVAQIEQLESLGLDMTNVTDEQLGDLAPLSKLRILWLSGTQIGDEGLTPLRSMASLQVLHLSDTQVTEDGASELQRSLPNCQVTRSTRQEPGGVRPIRRPPPRAMP
jgi:hypothetical protein